MHGAESRKPVRDVPATWYGAMLQLSTVALPQLIIS
jgi:hypothetical protein